MPEERSALQKVMWFGILQLAGLVVGWVILFYIFGILFSSLAALSPGPNTPPSQVIAVFGSLFQNLALVVPTTSVVQIIGLVFLIVALRQLKRVDERFSVPSMLALLTPVGFVVAAVGLFPLFNEISILFAQVPTTPSTPTPPAFASALATIFFTEVILVIAGVVSLVGLIGGVILGLWRVGSKYDETLMKLGAIFTIIPFLNIVAPILLIVGARQARNKIPATM